MLNPESTRVCAHGGSITLYTKYALATVANTQRMNKMIPSARTWPDAETRLQIASTSDLKTTSAMDWVHSGPLRTSLQ
jgi:hypothetical protein